MKTLYVKKNLQILLLIKLKKMVHQYSVQNLIILIKEIITFLINNILNQEFFKFQTIKIKIKKKRKRKKRRKKQKQMSNKNFKRNQKYKIKD